jgi:amino-acid N-acetyltransferase
MDIFGTPNLSAVKQLLSESSLPISDITAQHLQHFFGCGSGLELEGLVGLELYGEAALLRSLAVASSRRGSGVGSGLVAHAERHARDQGVQSLYLLTTTAEQFFLRRGYTRIPRDAAPTAIKSTKEFSGICPASSTFMVKQLMTMIDNPHPKVRII